MTRKARAGFTLLEMLLAITLLSLIMGALLGGLHMGRRSWETGRTYEGVSEVEEAARAIGDQLARIYPVQVPMRDNAAAVAFLGGPDSCRLVALSEGGAQYGGLVLTEIGGDGGGVGLWTQVFRAPDWSTVGRGAMNAVAVLRDAAYFRLSYFGEVERGKPPVWTEQWVDREGLPLLVGVRLGGRRSGKVVDASFVVAVRHACAATFYKCPENVAR
jgi:general secretion pathway protein J